MRKMKKPNYNKVCDNYQVIANKAQFRAWMKEQGIRFLDEGIK